MNTTYPEVRRAVSRKRSRALCFCCMWTNTDLSLFVEKIEVKSLISVEKFEVGFCWLCWFFFSPQQRLWIFLTIVFKTRTVSEFAIQKFCVYVKFQDFHNFTQFGQTLLRSFLWNVLKNNLSSPQCSQTSHFLFT